MNNFHKISNDFDRRKFLSSIGKSVGMMALSSTVVASLFENLQAKVQGIEHLSAEQVATDEDFWAVIQPIVHEEFTGIRITPNVYTTLWELDRFCEIVGKIARNGLPKV